LLGFLLRISHANATERIGGNVVQVTLD